MSPHTVTTTKLARNRTCLGRAAVIAVIAIASAPFAADAQVPQPASEPASYARISGDLEANKVGAMNALLRRAAERHQNSPSHCGDLEDRRAALEELAG